MNDALQPAGKRGAVTVGCLSGRPLFCPAINAPPMPALAAPGVIYNGQPAEHFGRIDSRRGYPDVRSFRRKFGLIVPATNTSMEHELWSIIGSNAALQGIGLHTTNVVTPKPTLETEDDLRFYGKQFLAGLKAAVDEALLAEPEYLIMGMSLEHILQGMDPIRASMTEVESFAPISWTTWHEAVHAGLQRFGARRIGLLSPFDKKGNENATRMFEDLGYHVIASVGFSCAHAVHIAHVPDWAKEKAILELLVTEANALDAIVQCGTNLSLIDVAEKLEPQIGIPILGINATTFWHALRENGVSDSLAGGGRLMREF